MARDSLFERISEEENICKITDIEFFKSIINNSLDFFTIFDEEFIIQYQSPFITDTFQYDSNELLGNHSLDYIHPDDNSTVNSIFENLSKDSNLVANAEIRLKTKNKGWRTVEVNFSNIFTGKRKFIIASYRDITEKIKSQRALELLNTIATTSNEASSVEVVFENALREICDYTQWPIGHVYYVAEENNSILFPSNIWFIEDEDRYALFKNISEHVVLSAGEGLPGKSLLSKKAEWMGEDCFPHPERSELIAQAGLEAGFAFPVMVGKNVVAVMEFFSEHSAEPDEKLLELMDQIGTQLGRVAERERATKELIIAKEKAENSDKVKSEFLAQISHEIRTPVNTICSFASLLKQELAETISEDLRIGFDMMQTGSKRLIRTIDLILNMSEIQTGTFDLKFEKINLINEIIFPNYYDFSTAAKRKQLALEIKNSLPEETVISGDKYTLNQIFNHLIDNAVKFTHEGHITISCYFDENDNITVKISDTGVGISKEYQLNLFKLFSQEETGYTRKFEGNGLGLALVKKYCELNNASIDLLSEKGKGATFTVTFLTKAEATPKTSISML